MSRTDLTASLNKCSPETFLSSMHKCAYIFCKGSKPPGEYFNPGYDCLEILTQNRKAKDGYYWVDFHRPVPYKVCI